jgi:multidrug efflux pump subunit AcrB
VAGFLFVPMAKAVVFAMIASFILSRTLVPTMGNWLLRAHAGRTPMNTWPPMTPPPASPARTTLPQVPARFREAFREDPQLVWACCRWPWPIGASS